MPEMGLVTVFWPLTMTGDGETVVQAPGETRFVVDCRDKPVALVAISRECICWGAGDCQLRRSD